MTDHERIAHYRAERDAALSVVADIDSGGWRFFEAQGDEAMRDVTDARRTEQERVAERMEELAVAWERLSA